MNSREQFEAWFQASWAEQGGEPVNSLNVDDRGQYTDTYVHEFWIVWQASRACATPEWEHAPDWANWLAMNDDGRWYWFAKEPELRSTTWSNVWGSHVTEAWRTIGRSGWTETLEQRP